MAEILEYFPDGGHRPGFPGNHGPGWYLIDYVARTIRPKPLSQGDELLAEDMPVESLLNAKNEGSGRRGSVATVEEVVTQAQEATPEQPMEEAAEPDSSVSPQA